MFFDGDRLAADGIRCDTAGNVWCGFLRRRGPGRRGGVRTGRHADRPNPAAGALRQCLLRWAASGTGCSWRRASRSMRCTWRRRASEADECDRRSICSHGLPVVQFMHPASGTVRTMRSVCLAIDVSCFVETINLRPGRFAVVLPAWIVGAARHQTVNQSRPGIRGSGQSI